MFFFTGQQDRAIDQLKKVIEMDPDFPITHLFLAMAYEQKGNHQSAIAELEKLAQTAGGRTIFSAELGYVYGRSGRSDEALRIVEQLKIPAAATQPIPAYEIALVYAGLGEKKLAFEWLDRAKAEHDPFLISSDRPEFRQSAGRFRARHAIEISRRFTPVRAQGSPALRWMLLP